MVWEPKTCCCGASIKTGTLILGWMSLIGSVIQVISMLRYAAFSQEDFVNMCDMIIEAKISAEMCVHSFTGAIISVGLTSALSIAVCGMLLWGVNKFKPMMMIPYLIMRVTGLVLFGLLIVAVIALLIYNHLWLGAFFALIILGGLMFLDVYFFLIVRVCYKEVKHSLAMMDHTNITYMEQPDIPYKM